MSILLVLTGFILAFILIFCYEYRIKLIKTELRNRVHFYVARDKDGTLWLYLSKPRRLETKFGVCKRGGVLTWSKYFSEYGLSVRDFESLKWEDKPVEVFLNLEE